jgi:hypothetical protein
MINNLQQAVDQAIASNNMNGGGGYPIQQSRSPWGAAHMGGNGFPSQQQLNQQWGMQGVGMPYQMYVPEEYDGYIVSQANPYAIGPNAQTWNDYTTGMQEDYGHYSPPKAKAPAPAKPKPSKYDYSKYLSGEIWNTRVRNASGKDWSERLLGDVGRGLSYGNFDNYSKYAPKKPGADATAQDWSNYRQAQQLWSQGLSNAGSGPQLGGYGMGKKRLDALDYSTVNWDHLYAGYNNPSAAERLGLTNDGGG